MSTLSEISRLIKEIRVFLETRMTPQFMNSVQEAMTAIRNMIGDPNVQSNFREVLVQLRVLLESTNSNNVVGNISEVVTQLREMLNHIDPQEISDIIHAINNLITAADQANIIQNINTALESISCLRDLVDIAKQLSTPATIFLYGATGAMIGAVLIAGIQTYLESKKDQKLQKSLDHLVALSSAQLDVQINNLRFNAGQYLFAIERFKHRNPGFNLSERLQRLEAEATLLLNILSPMDINNLELLQKAHEFCNGILRNVYQPDLDNENMSDYLGRIGSNPQELDEVIDYIACEPQYKIWGKNERPTLPREELNYLQVRKLYGKSIDTIMNGLVSQFATHGKDLYLGLANSAEDATPHFSQCMKQVVQQDEDFLFPETPWRSGAMMLVESYNNADQFIATEWTNTNWTHLGLALLPNLTTRISNIIKGRAVAEYCHQISPYLCFPRNVPRDIYNGVTDYPAGLWQTITHPIDTVCNLFSIDAWKNLGHRAYAHPARFFTTQAISVGVAGATASYLHTPGNHVPTGTHIPKTAHIPRGAHVPGSTPHGAFPPAPTSVPASFAAGFGGSRNFAHQHDNSAASDGEVEMTTIPAEIVASGSVSQASLSQLKESLDEVNTIEDFDLMVNKWYDEIIQDMMDTGPMPAATFISETATILAENSIFLANEKTNLISDVINQPETATASEMGLFSSTGTRSESRLVAASSANLFR